MTLDHNDPELRRMFDIELAGVRSGLPDECPLNVTCEADLNHIEGRRLAHHRSPDALDELAARFTVTATAQGQLKVEPPDELPAGIDPTLVERAGMIAYLDARARARAASVPRS